MRAPSESDLCQARLYQMVEAFMRDDMLAFRDACEWLRDYADQNKRGRGLVHSSGSYWRRPQDKHGAVDCAQFGHKGTLNRV